MRTKLALFLLSGVLVYGCVQHAEKLQMVTQSGDESVIIAPPVPYEAKCDSLNPCVTVHTIELNSVGECPSGVTPVGSQDVVKFVNNTDRRVHVKGLDSRGSYVKKPDSLVEAYLSPIKILRLGAKPKPDTARGAPPRDTLESIGYFQVLKSPFNAHRQGPQAYYQKSLIFKYDVSYVGYPGGSCNFEDHSKGSSAQNFWSVPPSMIVGPDTL